MLNLDTIKFTADTSELDLASKKLDALGVAITGLSVDLSKLDKSSSAAAKAQAEANLANAKAEAIISKTSKATKDKADADDQSTKAVKENTSVLERQQSILEFMTQGFSKGQSSTLAYAKSTGILTDDLLELQSVLQSQRTLIGGDPFDKSLGALKSLQNEFKVLKEVQRLYNAEIPITHKQMENLALDKLRLIEAMKIEGKSMTEIKMAIRDLNADYIGLATSINRITAADDALAKSNQDSIKAMGFLSREMERVDAVLTGFNDNLNVTSSNRLMKFREQLRLSGTDAATAATMLKGYEEKLRTINSVSQSKAKNSREEELRYLARATSVQLGDIGISLAGGQNPLLVLIQQGDQLRGVLNQVSANGQEMQKALSMAFGQIVNGSKDVVMALGSFVVGAFADSGKAVARFGADILGVSGAIERLKAAKFAEWAAEGEAGFSKISRAMKVSELAVSALGAGIGVFVALAAASTVALYQVTSANDDLTRSLVATGAQLGFTTEYAQGLATVLTGMGATRVDVLNAFSEISKSGNITAESFLQVAEAALAIERVGGPAVKETVALMGQLKEKSVETLTKYAEQTGLVTVAQIAYVAELVNAGREISATTEATNILTAAIKEQAEITYASLSSMGRLWVDLKTGMNDAWGSLQDFVSSSGLLDGMTWAVGRVAANFLEVMHQLARGPRLMAEVAATAIAIAKDAGNLDTNFTEFNKIRTSINDIDKERQDAHDKQKRRLLQEGEFSTENIKKQSQAAADLRKINSEAASANAENIKVDKIIKDEADRAAVKTLTRQQFINKAIEDKNKLLREGSNLSKEQLAIIEKTAGIEYDKANKPKKAPKSDAMKGAEDDASWYRKSIERIDDLKNKTIGAVEQLSKAQVLLMDLADDDSFKKLSAQQQMRLVDRINEIDLIEQQLNQQKELAKSEKEIGKIRDDNTKFLAKEKEDQTKILQDSTMKLALLGKTADEQFAITEQYDLQNKLLATNLRFEAQILKLKQDYAKVGNTDDNAHVMEFELDRINQQWAETRDALTQNSANKFQIAYTEKILKVGAVLSDAITTALFEGGQAGTKKLKDYIVGIFREKINVQINAVVNSMLGVGGGNSGGSGGITGALSNISNGVGNILSSIGSATGITAGVGAFSSGMTLGSSAILPGLEMMSSASGISSFMAGAGQAAGGAFAAAGPYVLAAMALKELMAYKIEAKGNGLTATVGGSKGLASGSVGMYNEFEQTGGFLGGGVTTNRDWSTAGKGVSDYVTKSTLAIQAATKEYAKTLGLTTDAVDGFTKNIEVSLTGLDAKGQKEAIDKALGGFADEMISSLFGDSINSLAKEGETSSTTMQRLVSDIVNVNSALDLLGGALIPLGVEGAKLASSMVDAFGGVEKMNSTVSTYYDIMYSDAEKAQRATENLTKQFTKLGVEVPKSEVGFRNLVNGIDSTTSSGQRLIASLMELAPAFDQVSQNAQQAAADMLDALQNYGTPQEVRQFEIGNIVGALANAGLTLTQDQITNATVASVRELYMQLNANSSTQGQAAALMQQQQAIFSLISNRDNGTDGYGSNGLMPGSSSGSAGGESSSGEQSTIDKSIQATRDYNEAMLQATGTTEEIAAAQRALSNASKLAAGWTQIQIDTLNRAIDLKDNLATLEQARTDVIGLFRTIEENAKSAQAAVDSAKSSITQGYLSAVDRQTQAQENVNALLRQTAEEMRGFSNGIKDFLIEVGGSDLGTNSKLEQLDVLQTEFNKIADLARGGDKKAFGQVTDKARGLLTSGKSQFASAEDFARFSAGIGSTLTELSGIADAQAGPVVEAIDPMVAAQQELALATADVVKWTEAVSISGAETANAATDYLDEWRIANAANIVAQAEYKQAQEMTKIVGMETLSVLQQLVQAMRTFGVANAITPVYGGNVASNPAGNSYAGMGSNVKTIQDLYSVNLGRQGDVSGMNYWAKEFLADGVIDAAERQRFAMSSLAERRSQFPSFATGIDEVPYDMTANIHQGERIMPAADNSELMARLSSPSISADATGLSEIVQQLNSRLTLIESNTASTAIHSAKTARLLDRAMPDGDAIATREAAAV